MKDPKSQAVKVTAARRRLGEWLSLRPGRTWSEFPPEPESRTMKNRWTIKLTSHGTDMAIAHANSWDKAVKAALAQVLSRE